MVFLTLERVGAYHVNSAPQYFRTSSSSRKMTSVYLGTDMYEKYVPLSTSDSEKEIDGVENLRWLLTTL